MEDSSHHFPLQLFDTGAIVLTGIPGPTSASINLASPGGRTLAHANNKASGIIFQNGALGRWGAARYYLASWGRTHLTPSRGRTRKKGAHKDRE